MQQHVRDIVSLQEIQGETKNFWLRDFKKCVSETDSIQNLPCTEQASEFFEIPVHRETHENSIVVDDSVGEIIESRTMIVMDGVDPQVISTQINALKNQHNMSSSMPINKDCNDWAFFVFSMFGNFAWLPLKNYFRQH